MTIPAIFPSGCAFITETLYPDSDVSTGDWIPSASGDLHSDLDADDSDYIVLSGGLLGLAECPSQDSSTCEVTVANPAGGPGPSDCQDLIVRFRARTAGSDTGCADLVVALREGTTTIASTSVTVSSSSFTTFGFTLSAAAYDSISDHDALKIEIEGLLGLDDALSSDFDIHVAFARLEYSAK